MKLHGNMTGATECDAIIPTLYPKERPIGPHNVFKVDDPRPGDDLEEHASKVMSCIENELAAKYHVDHVVDRYGTCTYLNRSNGLHLERTAGVASRGPIGGNPCLAP